MEIIFIKTPSNPDLVGLPFLLSASPSSSLIGHFLFVLTHLPMNPDDCNLFPLPNVFGFNSHMYFLSSVTVVPWVLYK